MPDTIPNPFLRNLPTNYEHKVPLDTHPLEVPIPQTIEEEEAEIEQVKQLTRKQYLLTPKFSAWRKAFLDKTLTHNGKRTFGNQTRSALYAYGLDETTQYAYAESLGSRNNKKLKGLIKQYYEQQDITEGKILDLIWNKAVTTNSTELIQWMAEVFDMNIPALPTKNNIGSQTNIQNNIAPGGGGMSLTFVEEGKENAPSS